ncbi:MAG: type II secretion system protein [Verrucomicrobia bacterium]|nr:type II secretion system protein [Verrucomicrobiota bacterium]
MNDSQARQMGGTLEYWNTVNLSSYEGRRNHRSPSRHDSVIPSIHHSTAPSLHAFTIIELLVVVAIISILAAMLMPAIKNAQETAKSAGCVNNLRQMSIAVVSYADDHDGWTPLPGWGSGTPPSGTIAFDWNWYCLITPYLTSEPFTPGGGAYTRFREIFLKDGRITGVFRCPSRKSSEINQTFSDGYHDINGVAWDDINYVANGGWGGIEPPTYGFRYQISQYKYPAELIWLLDGQRDIVFPWNPPSPNYTYIARHHQGVNILYADGHVGFRKGPLPAEPADDGHLWHANPWD